VTDYIVGFYFYSSLRAWLPCNPERHSFRIGRAFIPGFHRDRPFGAAWNSAIVATSKSLSRGVWISAGRTTNLAHPKSSALDFPESF
jgi:hypothetical protein